MTLSPVLRTLSDLVRIRSVNPAFEAASSEAEVVRYAERFFREHGIETRLQEVFPGRSNLIARLPGRHASRRMVFEAHADTVSTAGMTIPPFEPTVSDGRLYGRGACDTKAGLAALLHAAASLRKEGACPCEVWIIVAVDEEHAFRGAQKAVEGLEAAVAIISEPTDMRVVIASKGCLRWRIRTRGRAAHSSRPELGRNAIADMARVILALEADAARLGRLSDPCLGSPTLSVGVIEGGVQVNIVPEACSILVDRRLIPGEETPGVLESYRQLLAPLGVDVSMDPPLLEDPPMATPPDSPAVGAASRILRGMGLDGRPMGVPYGSDASKFSRAGIPSLLLGPGCIDQAHTAAEFVPCAQVEQALEFYRSFMQEFE